MSNEYNFPSTRFLGSKVKLLNWIWDNVKNIECETILDAFGGTSSVSYLFKKNGKTVYYNDILKFNKQIGLALIENKKTVLTQEDIINILKKRDDTKYPTLIRDTFNKIYFTKKENDWLDKTITNIHLIKNKYKRAISLSALFQACLIKRPFNLFHRKNLNLRMNDVPRTFGNKVSWDTKFPAHFIKFVDEYNKAVFDNGKPNKVIGGKDVFKLPKLVDLVYLDPPYLSNNSKINYHEYYHFIEGLSDYTKWEKKIDHFSSLKKLKENKNISRWLDRENIVDLFDQMIEHFKDSTIVLSYRNDGSPSKKEILDIIIKHKGKIPIVRMKDYKYALSNGSTKEILFIAE